MNCGDCTQFVNDPAQIEAMVPGLTTLGSAHASVRADDGICRLLDFILTAQDGCGRFSARVTKDRDQP
jgi:hypothetical protein